MTVNLSPEGFSGMTVNLSPETFKKTESAMAVNFGLQVAKHTAQSRVQMIVEKPRIFPDGATRYQVRVKANGTEWVVERRFSDFEFLEKQLVPSGVRRAALPVKGFLGVQRKLNLGNFNENRHSGLQAYLSSLAEHINSLSEMPALEAFCNPEVQAVAPPVGGNRVKTVAGAAAVGAAAGLMLPVVGGVVVAAAGAGAAAYATQRSDNIGEVSRKVGSVTADAFGKVAQAVKTAAER